MMKKFISLVLIAGSLVFAILIITEKPQQLKLEAEKVLADPAYSITEQRLSAEPIAQSVSAAENLTSDLASTISQEIIARNPNGPVNIQNKNWISTANPAELADKLFEQGLANFDSASLRPEIKLSQLKIIDDNDPLTLKSYVQNFKDIVAQNVTLKPIDNRLSFNDLRLLIAAYQKIIPQLYALSVPQKAAAIHQQGLTIFETQKNILEKLVLAEVDPVAALIAANFLPNLNKDIADFEAKLEKLSKS